ncbi:MAG: bifunctional 4-hydroxy-2-oxoglutarate aldolase/2-dehydro-3-deoxy-phosphogluconate aldolase [bacterium]|nr:bifunctional 4-hydroxy-2-oxoglutarate aldolase/2-dehydro-3-deoxy-phosphogluconate aldolase [bacterium]
MPTCDKRDANLKTIHETGVVAVIRADDSAQLLQACEALKEGGVTVMEVTMTTPDALDVIHEVSQKMKNDVVIGVGTVLDPETCRAAILAGAEFVVAPTLNLDVIRMAKRYSAAVFPGAYTPTEILTAWEAGADVVKVFPATSLGPKYFKDVLGPLPQVRLTPTGGVDLDTVGDFIKAGAWCVAAGGNLCGKKLLADRAWDKITATAKQFIEKVKEARAK